LSVRLGSTKFGVGTWNIQNAWYCDQILEDANTLKLILSTQTISDQYQLAVATMVNQNRQNNLMNPSKVKGNTRRWKRTKHV